jgi:formylglycine-generating enzyme required for sulfatase activity
MVRIVLVALVLLFQCFCAFVTPALAAGKRVALVIGNAAYSDVGPLANPESDSAAVAQALEASGFDDVRHVGNLTAEQMRQELKSFSALSANADIAVIYYAGHGVELADQNYLVPVDAKLLRSTDIEFEAIPLSSVRQAVSGASKLRIVVLDACRNNPFKLAGKGGTRAATRGLGRIEPGAGEVVAYAAKEGTLAQDGPANQNSPFAAALVKSLREPGLEVRLLFGRVRDDVLAATGNEQEPYTYASLGGDALYLTPPSQLPAVQTFRDCGDCPEMVVVRPGTFLMGSPEDEPQRDPDEGPQHEVTIARSLAVGRFEVTRDEFDAFVKDANHDTGKRCTLWTGKAFVGREGHNVDNPGFAQTGKHPATCLSWHDAKDYVAWLSRRSGQTYRLLTEAEWEYVARAGIVAPYASGAQFDPASANGQSSATQAVGLSAANAFGLYDTQGNVWEWTEDCHSNDYAKAPIDGSAAQGSADCERTYRGGGWSNMAKDLRFATRGVGGADTRVNIFGLRVAREMRQ